MTKIIKETWTDTHVYFVNHIGSNWYSSPFEAPLWRDGPLWKFSNNEQYMMSGKAVLFDGQGSEFLHAIMRTTNPKEQKEIGRGIPNFDLDKWSANNREIVFRGSYYKFSQNSECEEWLKRVGSRFIVEGASYDDIWGVGLAWNNPRILDSRNWRGENRLGQVHNRLNQRYQEYEWNFDPWSESFSED
jgi:ribA/ribD-fused uncharacterized protein